MIDRLRKHLESITQEEFDKEIEEIEKIIGEKHNQILHFAEWFKESDWKCFDNTERGNVYTNVLVKDELFTIEQIYELYLSESTKK